MDVDDLTDWATQQLVVERLLVDALRAAGRASDDLDAFGSRDFLEPLTIVVDALETEARLHERGRWATHRYLRRLLDVRIQLHDWIDGDPGVLDEAIVEPIIVIGAPRTGTTAIHRLLAAIASHRTTEAWELLRPIPPPEPETFDTDPRIADVADELLFAQNASTELRRIHTYSARMPKECLSSMAFSFRSEEFISRYHVPSYVEWLQQADMTPAYDMHRLVLQVLQRRMPARRWVLKSPVHLQALPVVARTYADASFVVTHRDPAAILPSVSSLVATMRAAFSDHVDRVGIGKYHTDLYARSLNGLVDRIDDGTLVHVVHAKHADIVADAVEVACRIAGDVGVDVNGATVDALTDAATEERDDAPGLHRSDPRDYDIDPAAVRPLFQRYLDRFDE